MVVFLPAVEEFRCKCYITYSCHVVVSVLKLLHGYTCTLTFVSFQNNPRGVQGWIQEFSIGVQILFKKNKNKKQKKKKAFFAFYLFWLYGQGGPCSLEELHTVCNMDGLAYRFGSPSPFLPVPWWCVEGGAAGHGSFALSICLPLCCDCGVWVGGGGCSHSPCGPAYYLCLGLG